MRFLQINTTVNSGSTGRIAEEIGSLLLSKNHESFIAFGRKKNSSSSNLLRIGNLFDIALHGVKSRIFDRHGFGSPFATKILIRKILEIEPDLIHLHNLHGYYLNIEILFKFLKSYNFPIVWTLHDCWPFTGRCSYFSFVNCYKWKTRCFDCPNKYSYPRSWFLDRSKDNFNKKKQLFTGLNNLVLVTPSQWLADQLCFSFLNTYPKKILHNGIDLTLFRPVPYKEIKSKFGIQGKMILGVANVWDKRKGLNDFIHLNRLINNDSVIVLVGLKKYQIKQLPKGIIGFERTERIEELAAMYSAADVFVNPTLVDNFPTTNLEALACGTPVVTYNTGGSPEAIDENTGIVVERGNIQELWHAVETILDKGKDHFKPECRKRAEQMFSSHERYNDYYQLYLEMINRSEKERP